MRSTPRVVVLAGSLSTTSTADRVARCLARLVRQRGATVDLFSGRDLEFPFYRVGQVPEPARRYLETLAGAAAVVLVSPAYHGGPSGLLKNALDYVNELTDTPRPYLDGRLIGCVAVAGGDQGASSTLDMLRTIVHALRGWPTPLGLALSGERAEFSDDANPRHAKTARDLDVLAGQVLMELRSDADRPVPAIV